MLFLFDFTLEISSIIYYFSSFIIALRITSRVTRYRLASKNRTMRVLCHDVAKDHSNLCPKWSRGASWVLRRYVGWVFVSPVWPWGDGCKWKTSWLKKKGNQKANKNRKYKVNPNCSLLLEHIVLHNACMNQTAVTKNRPNHPEKKTKTKQKKQNPRHQNSFKSELLALKISPGSSALSDATQRHTCTHMKVIQVQPIKQHTQKTQRVSRSFWQIPVTWFSTVQIPLGGWWLSGEGCQDPKMGSLFESCADKGMEEERWGWWWQIREWRRKTAEEGRMGGGHRPSLKKGWWWRQRKGGTKEEMGRKFCARSLFQWEAFWIFWRPTRGRKVTVSCVL